MELTRLKRKLVTATRGRKLPKDKWDKLMRQFLDLVRESKTPREKMEAGIAAANQNFVLARPGMTDEALNVVLTAPKQEVYLETKTKNVTGVKILVFKYKTRTSDPNDIHPYGFALTSSDLDDTVKSLADLLSDMLRLAECGKSCQLMVVEIEKTCRCINTLEHVMIPDTQSNIRYITMKLDESERSSQIKFMKVKDVVPEEVHHYSEWEVVPAVNEM